MSKKSTHKILEKLFNKNWFKILLLNKYFYNKI